MLLRIAAIVLSVAGAFAYPAPMPVAGPPSGRPPIGPLQRYDPKLYDLTFAVTMMPALQQYANEEGAYATRPSYDLREAPIVMPLIYQSSFSRVTPDSVTGELWLDNRSTNPNLEIKDGFPFNTSLAVMTIGRFNGQAVRWKVGYRVQSWSATSNDGAAAQI